MKKVLILGATSPIARALAEEFAGDGALLFLAGRDPFELERVAADLRIRYRIGTHFGHVEAEDFASHASFVQSVVETLGGMDGVVLAIGYLGEQPRDSHDELMAHRIANSNFTSAVSLLAPIANLLEKQRHGFIMGLSSVAGDRGLILYLQGLRNRLDRVGVKVITLKLGFVDTAMTYGKKGLFLVASPEQAGQLAYQTLRKSAGVYYIPPFWGMIMFLIRLIPERVFKKLNL
jgi:decaprenylphospho-beta-D-erythro-pentofuranosid-2-ulose 2-reductase